MAMVVKNNMTAINTLNTLNKNSSALSKSLQKVSSGMKINSAADDASGYAISERMRVQIRSLDQANQNTQNGSSMMKVAEGAVSSTVEILKTLKEKAVNAANDSNTDSDRQTIQKELNQSIDQINDNANVTFNGKYLVDGSKNTIGNATYTALSNQSLKTDTTAATKLTDLAARSGDSLEIHDTNKVTVSYVKGGKTYSTTYQVKDTTLQDIFNKAEEVNKAEIGATYDAVKDALFASADNKSVGAAMVADKQMTQSDYDNIAATKQAAIDAADAAKTTATTGLDARITTLTTDAVYTGAKKAVDDYNTAVADWAAIAGTGSMGTNRIGAGSYTNAGEYMDNLLAADNNEFNTVATGGVDLTSITNAITAAGTAQIPLVTLMAL